MLRHSAIWLGAACALCFASACVAQTEAEAAPDAPAPALTLPAAVAEAFRASPQLEARRLEVIAAHEAAGVARAEERREWRLTGGLNGVAEQNAQPRFWFGHWGVWNEIKVLAYDGGKAKAAKLVALAEAVVAEAAYERAAADLELRVADGYFMVLQRQRACEAAQDGAVLVADHLRMASVRLDNGDASELDVLRARTELSAARAELAQAVAELAQAKRELALLLHRDLADVEGIAVAEAEPEATPTPVDEAAAAAVDHAPEVRIGFALVAVADAETDLADSLHRPDVDLGLSHAFDTDVTDSRHIFQAGIGWSLPLSDRGAHEHREHEAAALREAALADLRQTSAEAESAVRNAYEALDGARAELEYLTEAAELARTVHEKADFGYAEGAISMRDLLDARLDMTQAQFERLRAACEVQSQLAHVKRLTAPSIPAPADDEPIPAGRPASGRT